MLSKNQPWICLAGAKSTGENAIDEIRIGNTFNDVIGVGPPSGTMIMIK